MAARFAEAEAAIDGARVWCVAPTYDLADKVFREVWPTLRSTGRLAPGSSDSRGFAYTGGGGFVARRSADNPDSLIGEGLDFLVLDEAARIVRRVWDRELRPRLADRRGRALLITTPCGRNWIYDEYERWRAGQAPEWEWFVAPSWHNDAVFPGGRADPEILAAEAQYRAAGVEEIFGQEYGAQFAMFSGRVYKAWDPTRHVMPLAAARRGVVQIVGGVDWGYANPCALVVLGRTGDDGWRVLAEWSERGRTLDEVIGAAQGLAAQWGVRRWHCDPSEPAAIEAFARAGLPANPAINDVWAGILTVASAMARDGGFGVADSCPQTIRVLENYHHRPATSRADPREEPAKIDDHIADATRYAIVTEAGVTARRPEGLRLRL